MSLPEHLIRRNALLGRYAYAQLRPMACAISVGIYLTIATVIVILCISAHYNWQAFDERNFWRATIISFAALQFFLLWILGMYQTGSSIQQEQTEKSIDFFRLLPLTAKQKIGGILLGRNLVVLGLAIVNTLALSVCSLAKSVDGRLLMEFLAFSWAGGIAVMLCALLSATYERRGRMTSGPVLVIILSVFFLPYAIGIAANWHQMFPNGAFIYFFGWQLRLFVFLTLFALYFTAWMVIGIVRRFENERGPLFTPTGAIGCLVGAEIIAMGLAWKHLHNGTVAFVPFWLGTGSVALTIVFGSLRSWDDYSETYSRTLKRPGLTIANLSNMTVGFGLILLWSASACGVNILAGIPIPFGAIVVLATYALVFVTLMEFGVTYTPLTTRVYLLAGFVAGLHCILPLILAGIMDSHTPMLYSPFGYVIAICGAEKTSAAPVLVNAALVILFGLLAHRRYRVITAADIPLSPEHQAPSKSRTDNS
jgi:hypothetical protein